jgi:hypothetical protein
VPSRSSRVSRTWSSSCSARAASDDDVRTLIRRHGPLLLHSRRSGTPPRHGINASGPHVRTRNLNSTRCSTDGRCTRRSCRMWGGRPCTSRQCYSRPAAGLHGVRVRRTGGRAAHGAPRAASSPRATSSTGGTSHRAVASDALFRRPCQLPTLPHTTCGWRRRRRRDVVAPYLPMRPLAPGEQEAYEQPSQDASSGTLYEHCVVH